MGWAGMSQFLPVLLFRSRVFVNRIRDFRNIQASSLRFPGCPVNSFTVCGMSAPQQVLMLVGTQFPHFSSEVFPVHKYTPQRLRYRPYGPTNLAINHEGASTSCFIARHFDFYMHLQVTISKLPLNRERKRLIEFASKSGGHFETKIGGHISNNFFVDNGIL